MSKFNPNCAGYQVFTKDLSCVVLVITHSGRASFPKGKRDVVNNVRERPDVTALRELYEETGLKRTDIDVIPDLITYEDSNSGRAGEIYLGTAFLRDPNPKFNPQDTNEIKEVRLVPIDEAMNMLMPKRKKVLQEALTQLKSHVRNQNS